MIMIFHISWLGISTRCCTLLKRMVEDRQFNFNRSRKFNSFVSSCEMLDVKAKGCFFTWRNGHYEDFIQERLYLVLVNAAALGEFSDLEVFVPPTTGSDHNMLDLSLDARNFFRS